MGEQFVNVCAESTVPIHATTLSARDAKGRLTASCPRGMGLRIAAVAVMCIAAGVFSRECLLQLQSVASGQELGSMALMASAAAFVASIVFLVLVEVASITWRFARPEQQVRLALQRIRAGDVGFRVAFCRGEPLGRLAYECNGLLEWLNHNPPGGVRVDSDVYELEGDDEGAFS